MNAVISTAKNILEGTIKYFQLYPGVVDTQLRHRRMTTTGLDVKKTANNGRLMTTTGGSNITSCVEFMAECP